MEVRFCQLADQPDLYVAVDTAAGAISSFEADQNRSVARVPVAGRMPEPTHGWMWLNVLRRKAVRIATRACCVGNRSIRSSESRLRFAVQAVAGYQALCSGGALSVGRTELRTFTHFDEHLMHGAGSAALKKIFGDAAKSNSWPFWPWTVQTGLTGNAPSNSTPRFESCSRNSCGPVKTSAFRPQYRARDICLNVVRVKTLIGETFAPAIAAS